MRRAQRVPKQPRAERAPPCSRRAPHTRPPRPRTPARRTPSRWPWAAGESYKALAHTDLSVCVPVAWVVRARAAAIQLRRGAAGRCVLHHAVLRHGAGDQLPDAIILRDQGITKCCGVRAAETFTACIITQRRRSQGGSNVTPTRGAAEVEQQIRPETPLGVVLPAGLILARVSEGGRLPVTSALRRGSSTGATTAGTSSCQVDERVSSACNVRAMSSSVV